MKNLIEKSLKRALSGFESTYYENITFRNASKSDVFPLYIANMNDNFNKYLAWNQTNNVEELNELYKNFLKNEEYTSQITVSILDKDTAEWMGFIRCYEYRENIAGSIWLAPKFWGIKSKTIVKAAIQIYLENTYMDYLVDRVFKENIASIKIHEAIGAKRVGEDSFEKNNKKIEYYIYRIYKEEIIEPLELKKY